MDFETRAIHEGQEPDPATGALTTPIYLTSTYVQDAVGEHKGYDYSRVANPTRTALQQCLASLESAEHGVAFASGLGADDDDHAPAEPGRPDGADRGRLRRRLPHDVAGLRAQGLRLRLPAGSRLRGPRLASRRAHADRLDRDAVEPAAEHRRHREGGRCSACRRRDPRRRQHLRDAVSCSGRWSSAPTSSSTRRRSTSAATRTSSAASRRRTIRRSRNGSRSCRSPSAPCPGRSTAGSCCAASRRSQCACASTVTTLMRSPAFSSELRASSRCCIRGCRGIPATRSPRGRCDDFGGMISFLAEIGGGSPAIRREHDDLQARRIARRRREPDRAARHE